MIAVGDARLLLRGEGVKEVGHAREVEHLRGAGGRQRREDHESRRAAEAWGTHCRTCRMRTQRVLESAAYSEPRLRGECMSTHGHVCAWLRAGVHCPKLSSLVLDGNALDVPARDNGLK